MNKAEFIKKWANGRLAEMEADLKALMSLSIGDKCKVVDDIYIHIFEKGETVTIVSIDDTNPKYECINEDGDVDFLCAEELEKIEP